MLSIIKELKYLKTLVEFNIKPNPGLKVQIKHSLENLVDLDQILHDQGYQEKYMETNDFIESVDHSHLCDHYQTNEVKAVRSNLIDKFRINENKHGAEPEKVNL